MKTHWNFFVVQTDVTNQFFTDIRVNEYQFRRLMFSHIFRRTFRVGFIICFVRMGTLIIPLFSSPSLQLTKR